MPIDPAGTAPGITPKIDEPPVLNMRCKSPHCDSMTAIEMKHAGLPSGTRMYQCTKCKRSSGIPVGGSVDL